MSKQPIPLKNIFELPGAGHIPDEWKPFEFVVANLTYEYFSNGIIDFNFDSVKYYSGGDFIAFCRCPEISPSARSKCSAKAGRYNTSA